MKAANSSSKKTAEHLFVCLKLKNPKWYAVDGEELCRDNDLTRSRGSSARATRKKRKEFIFSRQIPAFGQSTNILY